MRARVWFLIALSLLLGLTGVASGQLADDQPKSALLIANSDYTMFGALANPVPEARAFATALRSIGFDVTVVENASRENMLDALHDFERLVRDRGGVALVHYGGHGVQVDGENYLIPANADIPDERRVTTRAVSVREIMSTLDASGSDTNIVILDACRNNPLPETSTRSAARGLGLVQFKPRNSLLVFSAQPGEVARDGLFTPSLTEHIVMPNTSLTEVLQTVRRDVFAKTSGEQLPGSYDELLTPVYLAGTMASTDTSPTITDDRPTVQVERATGTLIVGTEVAGTLFVDGVRIGVVGVGEELTLRNVVTGARELEIRGGDESVSATAHVVRDQQVSVVLRTAAARATDEGVEQVRDDAQGALPRPAGRLPATEETTGRVNGPLSIDLAAGVFLYDMDELVPLLEAGFSVYLSETFAIGIIAGLPIVGAQATFGDTTTSAFAARAGVSLADFTPVFGGRFYGGRFSFALDYALPDDPYPGELFMTVGYNLRF